MTSFSLSTFTTTAVAGNFKATFTTTLSFAESAATMASLTHISIPTGLQATTAVLTDAAQHTITSILTPSLVSGADYSNWFFPTGYAIATDLTAAESPTSSSGSTSSTTSAATTPNSIPASSARTTGLTIGTSSISTPSSSASTGSGIGSAAPASSTSASSSPSSSSSSSNTGLVAGVGVLAALLAIALIVIAFLLFKRRRRAPTGYRESPLGDAEGARSRNTEKDILLRDAQASLAANSGPGKEVLDDKYVAGQFARLNQDINDWVLAHFKHLVPSLHNLPADVRQAVSQQPNWPRLLQDSRGRFLIIRGIVADYLYEAFHTGDINGMGETMRMKNHLPENIPFHQQSRWRASTVGLMEQDSGFRGKQATAVQLLAQKIDHTTSTLAGLEPFDDRLRHLTRIVQFAADIALDLSRQRVDFYMFAPRDSPFDSAKMEDVLQEARGEDLDGAEVLSIVFPAVLRHGDVSGSEFDSVHVISKAQVLVNHDGRSI